MSQPTQHGENIANDIQTEDTYGDFNPLTLADVWSIVDNLHTHFMDNPTDENPDVVLRMFEGWMRQLEKIDDDLPL
jgi:hypothetical protein